MIYVAPKSQRIWAHCQGAKMQDRQTESNVSWAYITIAIRLQYDYDEKLTCSFFARVEWKQARGIRRSRIVVVLQSNRNCNHGIRGVWMKKVSYIRYWMCYFAAKRGSDAVLGSSGHHSRHRGCCGILQTSCWVWRRTGDVWLRHYTTQGTSHHRSAIYRMSQKYRIVNIVKVSAKRWPKIVKFSTALAATFLKIDAENYATVIKLTPANCCRLQEGSWVSHFVYGQPPRPPDKYKVIFMHNFQ